MFNSHLVLPFCSTLQKEILSNKNT